jgi:hypothetical protein
MPNTALIMRPAHSDDAAAIARLVELEEATPLVGETLVAQVDGTIVAALSVGDDRAVADIFRPTAGVVRMLRDWRAQLLATRRLSSAGSIQRPRAMRRLLALRRIEAAA